MESRYTASDIDLLRQMEPVLMESLEDTTERVHRFPISYSIETGNYDSYLHNVITMNTKDEGYRQMVNEFLFQTSLDDAPTYLGSLKDFSFLVKWRIHIGK